MRLAYLAATLLVVIAPGTDNLLAINRGLRQGLLSNLLNPKAGLFVVAFIPQFTHPERGSMSVQMLGYGAIFAVLTALIFALLAGFASRLSAWLARRPRVIDGVNVGAGLVFMAAGLSALALGRRPGV